MTVDRYTNKGKPFPPAVQAQQDDMLPDALVPVADEWYRLCERRFAVDKIKISGELAEAIVNAVSAKAVHPAADALGSVRELPEYWRSRSATGESASADELEAALGQGKAS